MYTGLAKVATASLTTLTMPAWEHLRVAWGEIELGRL